MGKFQKILVIGLGLLIIAVLAAAVWMNASPAKDLIIEQAAFHEDESGARAIAGQVKNTGDRPYSPVEVKIRLLNASGREIGVTGASTATVGAGMTWWFRAPVEWEEAADFRAEAYSPEEAGGFLRR